MRVFSCWFIVLRGMAISAIGVILSRLSGLKGGVMGLGNSGITL
jgi:hypothetical protein